MLLFLLALAQWGDADTGQNSSRNLAHLSLEQLANVEVTTASKEPEELWQTPAAVYVITREDIRRSGAASIPEALRLAPGVEVARIDSDHWSVAVRGFGSELSKSVLVLIDGRSVYSPLFAGVYWEVQDTLLEDVDRIEVIRGPGGTIWGANAVNAVINIITKKTKDTHGVFVSAGAGNLDRGMFGFRFGAGNGKNFDYRIYGKAFGRGPEFHSNHEPFDDWQTGQAGFRMDWSGQGPNEVTLQGDVYDGADGESVSIASYSPPAQSIVNGVDRVSGGNLLGRWRRKLGSGSDLQLQAYYDHTSRMGPQFGENRDTFDLDFVHHLTLPWQQNFLWGAGARWSPSEFIQTVPTVDFLPHNQTDSIYSAFVQDEIPIVRNRFSLTAGSKFERNNYTGWEAQPSVRLLWRPRERQAFWMGVTRAVRAPSQLDENIALTGLLLERPPVFIRISGTGKFVSERVLAYEAGYRALITSRLYLDIAAFRNDYNDLESFGLASVFGELAPPPHIVIDFPFVNGVKGATTGFEIAPDWTVASWWRLKGSYSYLHMSLENRPGNTDTGTVAADEGSSPHHQIGIQSFFDLPGGFEFDQTYRYVSELPAQPVPGYSTADVRFGWRFSHRYELSIAGQNLLQPFHVEFSGDPGPLVGIKRSVYGQITWRK